MGDKTDEKTNLFPNQCEIEITFPREPHADQAKQVLEVDAEVGGKVEKSFRVDGNVLFV